jgi:hypothetical protein
MHTPRNNFFLISHPHSPLGKDMAEDSSDDDEDIFKCETFMDYKPDVDRVYSDEFEAFDHKVHI